MPFLNRMPALAGRVLLLAVTAVAAAGPASAAKFKTLYGFCAQANCADGGDPVAAMTQDGNGVLYGTTLDGGTGNGGTVFALVPNAKKTKYKHSVLYNFGGDGSFPRAKLILDAAGNLYGTTSDNNGDGTAFELVRGAHKSWTHKTLYRFCSTGGSDCTDGRDPEGGLTYAGASSGLPYDGTSPLYGATAAGNAQGAGLVYQLTPPAAGDGLWTETVLHNFCSGCGTDGLGPVGSLIMDATGNIYGATVTGGQGGSGRGSVFELSPKGRNSWKETILYTFCSVSACADGAFPFAGLAMDAAGALYGTTEEGGDSVNHHGRCFDSNGCGTVFKVVPNGGASQETVLYSFCSQASCKDGAWPVTEVAIDASGALFGTTEYGGKGQDVDVAQRAGGILFRYADGQFDVLRSFCSLDNCADGGRLDGGVIVDGDDVIYGVTTERGPNAFGGTVFKYGP
jgi:hypothetical protein